MLEAWGSLWVRVRVLSAFFCQSLLEPSSKLLSFVIQYGVFSLSYLVELCGLCYKTFSKVSVQSIGLHCMGFLQYCGKWKYSFMKDVVMDSLEAFHALLYP